MLANKPLSPHILPVSHAPAVVETHQMVLDHSLSIEAPAPFKHECTIVTKSSFEQDSISSSVTESYPEDNTIEAPSHNQINANDQSLESVTPHVLPVLIAPSSPQVSESMDDINEREMLEAVGEDFILDSLFSDDLSDDAEMDLDHVAHVPVELSISDIDLFISPKVKEDLESSQSLKSYNERLLSVKSMLFPAGGGMTEFNTQKPVANKASKTPKPNPDQPASETKKQLVKPRRDSESTERTRFNSNNSKPSSRDGQPNDTYAKSSSRPSISESKQKQSKNKPTTVKKQRDRDDFHHTSRPDKIPTAPEGQNFDDLLESAVRSQIGPENNTIRRGSEPKERKNTEGSRSTSYTNAVNSQPSSSSSHASSISRRIPERDTRMQEYRAPIPTDTRRASRTEGQYPEAIIRSPPRSSSRPSGMRGTSKIIQSSESYQSVESQKD
ncbi:hypothetical protein DSO57_1025481 [Entomophthora muscae]|uniref:Uncharacterized protein n=1 Tax=Entomophthora muscae TaxID=34485 RepID=A0ACC2RTE8_9FUNG|nr:hypothetical protein DSO57_1025481 [Entomophthora muscae]